MPGTYLVTVNLILSATANILSRFCEPKVQGFLKGIPGGSPSIITDPGLLLIRLYGTCTGYLIPKASPGRQVSGKSTGCQGCSSGSIPSIAKAQCGMGSEAPRQVLDQGPIFSGHLHNGNGGVPRQHECAAELVGMRRGTILYGDARAVWWEGWKAAALCFGTLFGGKSIGVFPV